MHSFWLWIASFGKIRKDELFGFLEFVIPQQVEDFHSTLRRTISADLVEIGQYQKIGLVQEVTGQENLLSMGLYQAIQAGIPPMLLMAFLRNQGVSSVDALIHEVERMIALHDVRSFGTGLLEPIYSENHPTLSEV